MDNVTEEQKQQFVAKALSTPPPIECWGDFLLEKNDEEIRFVAKAAFLDYYSRKIGEFGEVKVRCNSENNTPITIDECKLVVDVRVKVGGKFAAQRYTIGPKAIQGEPL